MSRPEPTSRIAAEILLVCVSVASLLGGLRLFADASFLAPVIGDDPAGARARGATAARPLRRESRRAGVPGAVAGLQLWVHYPHTTSYGAPRWDTIEALSNDFRAAWDTILNSEVPVAAGTGLVVAASAFAWLLPVLADWAAFRVRARGEALVPAGIVLAVIAIFGTDDGRILFPALVVTAAVAFALAHQRSMSAPATSRSEHRQLRMPRGLFAGAAAVAGGMLVTTLLMPVLSEGPLRSLLEPTESPAGDGRKVVLSPLVSLPGQLLNDPDRELFTVASPQAAYWRLTALGDFDGVVWSLDEKTGTATGTLANVTATPDRSTEVPQTYRIGALAAVWLPAAYQPIGFEAVGSPFKAGFEPISSTLLVGSSQRNSDGLAYSVRSAVPRFDSTFLTALRNDPADLPEGFTEIPAGLSPVFADLAADITEGSPAPTGRLSPCRTGSVVNSPTTWKWRRDTRVSASSCSCWPNGAATASSSPPPSPRWRELWGYPPGWPSVSPRGWRRAPTLRESRSTASAGRTPTPGRRSTSDGAGWVAFEPTPGRGAPGAESYTLVPEQQDNTDPTGPPPDATVPDEPRRPRADHPPPRCRRRRVPVPTASPSPATAPDEATAGSARRAPQGARSGVGAGGSRAGRRRRSSTPSLTAGPSFRLQRRWHRRRWAARRRRAAARWWPGRRFVGLLRPAAASDRTPIRDASRSGPASRPAARNSAPEPWRRLAFCASVAVVRRRTPFRPSCGSTVPTASASADHRRRCGSPEIWRNASGYGVRFDPYPWVLLLRAARRSG